MNVLSLFDGMSCGQLALGKAGIKYENYFASEVDKYAIKVSSENFPNTIHLGDVTKISLEVVNFKDVYERESLLGLQNHISRHELLYWLNRKSNVAASIGTQEQVEKSEAQKNPSICENSRIWSFERNGANNRHIETIIRDGGDREGEYCKRYGENFKYSIGRHGHGQHKSGTEKESFAGPNWERDEARDEGEVKTKCNQTVRIAGIKGQTSRICQNEQKVEKITILRTEYFLYILPFEFDLVISGSPCQGFSFAGKQLNFNDPRSALFFEFVKALKILKPRYFLLENVKMKKEYQDVISDLLGVQPIEINSALVSAQNRRRLYWTNIPNVTQPIDKKIYLKDIIDGGADMVQLLKGRGNNPGGIRAEDGKSIPLTSSSFEQNCFLVDREKAHCLDASYFKGGNLELYFEKHRRQLVFQINPSKKSGGKQPYMQDRVFSLEGKSHALTSSFASRTNIQDLDLKCRKLTVLECKRLQTVPDDYKMNVSNTQAYKMLGNGWTVDVIAHILSGIRED